MVKVQPPRRNRYYYGKLLDVEHFSMEQDYVLQHQRRLNRAVLGTGVVSGLCVTAVQSGPDWGIRIEPGLAIDGLGRLIVVPDEVDLIPLRPTDEHGSPVGRPGDPLPAQLVVRLCYCECPTDIGPALAAHPC